MIDEEVTNEHFIDALGPEKVKLSRPSATLGVLKFFYEKGHKVALRDAINYCKFLSTKFPTEEEHYLSPRYFFPNWVLDGMIQMIENSYLSKGEVTGKGRLGNSVTEFENNQRHLVRYIAVLKARQETNGEGKSLRDHAAFERAKEILAKQMHHIGVEQIKKSWFKVKREIGSEDFFHKYYPVSNPIGATKISLDEIV